MKILVAGATGMTGRLVVEQLLDSGHEVVAIVRSPQKFSDTMFENEKLEVVRAAILDMSDLQLAEHVANCDAIVSCLGHTMDFNGIFGHPGYLCRDAVMRLCRALEVNNSSMTTKLILMNSVGVHDPEGDKTRSWYDRLTLTLLHHLLPPHRDNEAAAGFLHEKTGKANQHIEWCIVRPDSLINADISPYDLHKSPDTGIFSGRPTARSNVAHFMVSLIENTNLWEKWKFRRPVIMNAKDVPEVP